MKVLSQDPDSASFGRPQPLAYASGVARHISSDGCQFVVEQDDVVAGQCFRLALADHPPVRGTVRWVVADRVGFAFERPISRDVQVALQQRCRSGLGLDLFLA